MPKEINYEIVDDFDKLIDEKGNIFISLRKIVWNGKGSPKLDLRRWYSNSDGTEGIGKGTSFLTEDGPHELAEVLVEEGYGDTKKILKSLAKRANIEIPEDFDNNDEYFDMSEIINNINERGE